MIIIKHTIPYYLFGIVVLLNGCSNGYDNYVYQRPQSTPLPELPEISSVRVEPAPRYIPRQQPKAVKVVKVKPKKVQRNVEPYKPKIKKYSPEDASDSVVTQKEVAAVTLDKHWDTVRKQAVVDTDPYANIPDSSDALIKKAIPIPTSSPRITSSVAPQKNQAQEVVNVNLRKSPPPPPTESSSAVTTLLVQAKADLALGRKTSAIGKLERGLRIEPRNAELWYQLAKTHYAQKNYSQTISMAKKSIQNTGRDYIIAKNWILIQKAGKKSGDNTAVIEADNYLKSNP